MILQNEDGSKFINVHDIIMGFFYLFIYKDFVVREIVHKFTSMTKRNTLKKNKSMNEMFLNKIITHINFEGFRQNHFT